VDFRVEYAAMVNAKRITFDLTLRMCLGDLSGHTGYTWVLTFFPSVLSMEHTFSLILLEA
jgi:hypothetical protein